jgi:hypothetical protein
MVILVVAVDIIAFLHSATQLHLRENTGQQECPSTLFVHQ